MDKHSLISISDLNKDEILALLKRAQEFEKNPNQRILAGKVVASLFFEPSTRTRLSLKQPSIDWEDESSDSATQRAAARLRARASRTPS